MDVKRVVEYLRAVENPALDKDAFGLSYDGRRISDMFEHEANVDCIE
jgi:hypothetical protein